ncbi:MAG: hypothetical protein CMH56_05520 [Myxococcales bacterium]|nr:hypothetical protein [Myxococcales bacterium]
MDLKRFLQFGFSLLVGGVLLWLSFRHVDWNEAKANLSQVTAWGVLLYCLAFGLQWVARTLRWRLQIEATNEVKPPLQLALCINVVAMAAVFFVPLRLGELVRPYLCRKYKLAKMSEALAHSAVERVTDGIVTTAFLLFVLFMMPKENLPDVIFNGAWIAAGIFLGGVCFLGFAYFWRQPALNLLTRCLFFAPVGLKGKLIGLLETFLDGISCFANWKAFFAYLFYTGLFWGLNGWSMWFLIDLMGIDVPVTAGFFAMCCLVLGVMVPAPPANVGNFEYAILVGVTPFGLSASVAAAFAFLLHTIQLLMMLTVAVLIISVGGVSLAGIRDGRDEPSPEEA